jgi:hypothetical protein
MDHFGDTLTRDPYETYDKNPQQADSSTIATGNTSGVPVPEPRDPLDPNGQTAAETLVSEYSQSPSLRPLSTINPDSASINRLTYIDENFDYYPSKPLPAIDERQDASLMHNAAGVGRSRGYQDLEYADPSDENSRGNVEKAPLARFMEKAKYPLDQRIEDKKRGVGRQRYPFLSASTQSSHDLYDGCSLFLAWILTLVMVCVFIYELVVQSKAQGTPVSFKVRTSECVLVPLCTYLYCSQS